VNLFPGDDAIIHPLFGRRWRAIRLPSIRSAHEPRQTQCSGEVPDCIRAWDKDGENENAQPSDEERDVMTMKRLLALALIFMAPAVAAEEKLKVAFFGFEMISTSEAPASEAERLRLARLGDVFKEMLEASGRFEIAAIPEALAGRIAKEIKLSTCNACEVEFAREIGADVAAFGTVQKVSNLILNENLYMRRADGAPFFAQSVDIRGNTDESWERGLRYMLKNHLLAGH
jgi:hypothetical protein